MRIKVVGFDPSMSNFGICKAELEVTGQQTPEIIIIDLQLIKTEGESKKGVIKQSDDLRRAKDIYGHMILACQGNNLAFSEIPLGNAAMYNNAILSAGMMVGILAACPIPLIQVFPKDVKIAAVGHPHAVKEEMIDWAINRYPTAPWLMRKRKEAMVPIAANEHLADAVATIEAGIRTTQFQQAIAIYQSMRQTA